MSLSVQGFDWDQGNLDKCQMHGVTIEAIEGLFRASQFLVQPDLANSSVETRFRAVGKTAEGRSIFVVFTLRDRDGHQLVRPISARYMHEKEVAAFEKENS
jgi:uncharacterized protein